MESERTVRDSLGPILKSVAPRAVRQDPTPRPAWWKRMRTRDALATIVVGSLLAATACGYAVRGIAAVCGLDLGRFAQRPHITLLLAILLAVVFRFTRR